MECLRADILQSYYSMFFFSLNIVFRLGMSFVTFFYDVGSLRANKDTNYLVNLVVTLQKQEKWLQDVVTVFQYYISPSYAIEDDVCRNKITGDKSSSLACHWHYKH